MLDGMMAFGKLETGLPRRQLLAVARTQWEILLRVYYGR